MNYDKDGIQVNSDPLDERNKAVLGWYYEVEGCRGVIATIGSLAHEDRPKLRGWFVPHGEYGVIPNRILGRYLFCSLDTAKEALLK